MRPDIAAIRTHTLLTAPWTSWDVASVMVALYFLNNHWGDTQILLLCWALMNWVRFTSQLGFQNFIIRGNHFYFPHWEMGSVIPCSPYLSPYGCWSRSKLSLSIPADSFPQSRKHIVSFNPQVARSGINCAALDIIPHVSKISVSIFTPKNNLTSFFIYMFTILKWYFKIRNVNFYLGYNLTKFLVYAQF